MDIYLGVLIVSIFFLFKEVNKERNKSRVIQLLLEGLFEYLILSNFTEYHNKTDKVYEKIQLYRFLIKKFEDQFGEDSWNDFFVRNQRANWLLFQDTNYGMEPLRSVYLPFFILCLYKETKTRKDAERMINAQSMPLEILAEIKSIISHEKFNEISTYE